uniref:WRKY domain-containing protein n=1 Tax=Syphacia muris TaxID=451379 RepID=A0A0N5AFK1_9BILA
MFTARCLEYPLDASRFPPSAASTSGNLNVTPLGHRDKRRFYVKKTCIGINEFKEWEDLLGDSWYRHHNKVNNIVYYHCKHEPCYASMKAKVMVECVQLYVTEEGHTHPPYANDFTTPLTFSPVSSQSGDFETNGFKAQSGNGVMPAIPSQKRKRQSEELFQQPVFNQQIFLNELLRMQNDNRDLKVEENSCSCADNDTPVSTSTDVKTELYQATSLSTGDKPIENASTSDSLHCGDAAMSVGILPMQCNDDGKNLQKPQTAATLDGNPCRQSSPSSSPEEQNSNLATSSMSSKQLLPVKNTNYKESDDDFSNSEDSFDNDIDSSPDRAPFSGMKSVDKKDLFSMLKYEIEGKPIHRRLKHLRKLKHQLYYFLEMEELKCLASRVPPTTKYEDIFKSNKSS